MMMSSLQMDTPPNPIHDQNNVVLPRLDDDMTVKLQSEVLPLEVQLMLEPMWTVRSKYHDCMRPLDLAMEQYMKFRCRLKEIDLQIELGTATNLDIATAFDQVFRLLSTYENNQKELQGIMKEVSHQILSYAHSSKNDVIWNEMLQLKEIDYASFTRRTCTFEHVVTCLFKLDENLKESLRSSMEISKSCANYLIRIAQNFNFDSKEVVDPEDLESVTASSTASSLPIGENPLPLSSTIPVMLEKKNDAISRSESRKTIFPALL